MATVTAADVKRLRELTDAPMMACKKALDDAEGDFEKAAELVRERTGAKMDARAAERTASEGAVFSHVDDGTGALVQLSCETDFVAKGERFQALGSAIARLVARTGETEVEALMSTDLDGETVAAALSAAQAVLGEKLEVAAAQRYEGHPTAYLHIPMPGAPAKIGVMVDFDSEVDADLAKGICQHIAFSNPMVLTQDQVDEKLLEKEKDFARKELREQGKSEEMIENILKGKVKKIYSEWVLNDQPYILDDKKAVSAVMADAGASITDFTRLQVG